MHVCLHACMHAHLDSLQLYLHLSASLARVHVESGCASLSELMGLSALAVFLGRVCV